ncbi:MAG: hypothetical protein HY553_03545 [Elusimicrobia bacterium]|nr:hypothetical protein [Elusimicrobiota bacterium]
MHLALALLLAAPASAEPPPVSAWVEADPGGSTSDGNVSAPEKLTFWERLQEKTFNGVCRQIHLPVGYSRRLGDVAEPAGSFARYLLELPNGELAVIDEARLASPVGWLPHAAFDRGKLHADLNLFLGARIEGRSAVVRRLKTKKACAELLKLADFRTIKLAVPPTAERIMAMAEGEIWQLPVEFRVGLGGSVGDPLRFPVTVGLGAYRDGSVTVTLRRLDPRTIRFRLRLERAVVLDAQGRINANIPVLLIGLPGGATALAGALQGLAAGAIEAVNDYLAVQLRLSARRESGVRHVLEFELDPGDRAQMERLAAAIRGDLSVLTSLRAAAPDDRALLGEAPSFAASDRYRRTHRPFKFSLPIAGRYERSVSAESDRVVLEDQGGGSTSIYRSERRSRRAFLNLPVLGDLFARDAQQNADVLVRRGPDGEADGPAIVYVQQEGFVRQDGHDARALAERADDVVSRAGARGRTAGPRLGLPLERLAPPSPRNPPGAFWRESEVRRGVAALTVVLTEPAVREIVAATTKSLLGAYVNTLEGPARLMGDWLLAHASTGGRRVSYDRGDAWAAARRLAGGRGPAAWRLLWTAHQAARRVSLLSAQLGRARAASGEEGRAQALSRLLAGAGRGALAYGDVVRILVQLANPLAVSAEFFLHLAGSGPERRSRWLLHAQSRRDALIETATEAKSRFRRPTALTD